MRVKVSGRGQICLPAVFRKRLKILTGDVLEIIEDGESLTLYPVKKKESKKKIDELLDQTSGIWKHMEKDGANIVREIRKGSTRDVWGNKTNSDRY